MQIPAALETLYRAGVALARKSSTARVVIARAAPLAPAEAVPPSIRGPVVAELDAAVAASGEAGAPPFKGLEPLATRPATGVFRGDDVAVKALRPGFRATVRNDLALLDALAPALRAAFP